VKTLETDDGSPHTSRRHRLGYGRIWDHELVAAVIDIAGNGTGDTMMEGGGCAGLGDHDASSFVDITRIPRRFMPATAMYLFLVDDTIDRGGTLGGRIAGFVFPGLLLLELGSWIETLASPLSISGRCA